MSRMARDLWNIAAHSNFAGCGATVPHFARRLSSVLSTSINFHRQAWSRVWGMKALWEMESCVTRLG